MKSILLFLILIGSASLGRSQGVFQATLGTPPGNGGGLILGNFWFQIVGNQVNFAAFVGSPGIFPASSLNPILSVPGSLVGFSLGDAQAESFVPMQNALQNPFLPAPVLMPTGYDCDGNPYYLEAPGLISGDYYSGHFDLPAGFLQELRAGQGTISLNASIGGNLTVAAVPEPSMAALGLTAIGAALLAGRRQRALR
jgi:hypothetical protein